MNWKDPTFQKGALVLAGALCVVAGCLLPDGRAALMAAGAFLIGMAKTAPGDTKAAP